MRSTTGADRERLLANLRALGADVDRLPGIPDELAEWITQRTPDDLERIRKDVRELERVRLLPIK